MTSGDRGASLVEALLIVALLMAMMAIGAPMAAAARDAQHGRLAAQFIASTLRDARQQAVTSGMNAAVVFEETPEGWRFMRCDDHDANGVRRADIAAGIDRCEGPPRALGVWFGGTAIARDAAVPDLNGQFGGQPVAFGTARMASFSPLGTSAAGSVTIRTERGRHLAVRVVAATGRVRMARFDARTGRWHDLP